VKAKLVQSNWPTAALLRIQLEFLVMTAAGYLSECPPSWLSVRNQNGNKWRKMLNVTQGRHSTRSSLSGKRTFADQAKEGA
jgi:hypothetical protein